jgi:hypothetical protein
MHPLVASSVALALGALALAASRGQSPGGDPPRRGPIVDRLLDDLDRRLLEGVPKSPPDSHRPGATQPDNQPAAPSPPRAADPLAAIAEQMQSVQRRIASRDSSAVTQAQQAEIVARLDALLQRGRSGDSSRSEHSNIQPADAQQSTAEKPAMGSAAEPGAGTGEPGRGLADGRDSRVEHGAPADAEKLDIRDAIRRAWGHLPEKQREEMQAALSEQFLPQYERVIEEYYKRLADERSPNRP